MAVPDSEAQYVTFGLDDECFAVPVEVVREILDHQDAFRIPHGPDYLLGLRDVRGQGVPVIDLRLRLGMSRTTKTPHTRILVIDVKIADKALTLGLVADRVFEVTSFKHQSVESAPDIGVRWPSEYIAGVVRRETGFVVIIDLAKLFSPADAVSLVSADAGRTVAGSAAI
ncbi:chemotaxis protein CheW [Rhizobium sp. SG741]|jgi:purine-binding chemotaxis protein CheW|uniref:chemotaxis protein CheW n=1 Tax=Rhizobium sp. SG741 TaxID=2587114 RepID=UPI000DE0AF88|nr:chemotaxis protein CheW [Rhizobium sp. SG741]NKJ08856.1 purine-binding chemotaxis protein CheW [Rhizobium sp. SG741]